MPRMNKQIDVTRWSENCLIQLELEELNRAARCRAELEELIRETFGFVDSDFENAERGVSADSSMGSSIRHRKVSTPRARRLKR